MKEAAPIEAQKRAEEEAGAGSVLMRTRKGGFKGGYVMQGPRVLPTTLRGSMSFP